MAVMIKFRIGQEKVSSEPWKCDFNSSTQVCTHLNFRRYTGAASIAGGTMIFHAPITQNKNCLPSARGDTAVPCPFGSDLLGEVPLVLRCLRPALLRSVSAPHRGPAGGEMLQPLTLLPHRVSPSQPRWISIQCLQFSAGGARKLPNHRLVGIFGPRYTLTAGWASVSYSNSSSFCLFYFQVSQHRKVLLQWNVLERLFHFTLFWLKRQNEGMPSVWSLSSYVIPDLC